MNVLGNEFMKTTKNIINSEAFRTINCLIDNKSNNLQQNIHAFKHMAESCCCQEDYTISTRVSYEDDARGEIQLPIGIFSFKLLIQRMEEMLKHVDEIRELQQLKLRLLGDVDFPSNNSEIKTIFGDIETG
jgi:hypothetical protein